MRRSANRSALLSLPAIAFEFVGFCVPLAVLLVCSFWSTAGGELHPWGWTLDNYTTFFTESIYWRSLLKSVAFVSGASLVTLAVTFPFAYFVALRVSRRWRPLWVAAAVLPFSTSYLIRVFAWANLLGDGGLMNQALMNLHVTAAPIGVLGQGKPAVLITFVYLLFPLSFLISYVTLERINPAALQAAADLGASPRRALVRIVLPIARRGLVAGFALCFIGVIGDYVTPTLVGGTNGTLFINLVISKFAFSSQWALGSAFAFVLLAATLAFLVVAWRLVAARATQEEFGRSYAGSRSPLLRVYSLCCLGLIYLPIVLVVLFALNDSEVVGLPLTGLTTRWFAAAATDPYLLDALRTSLIVMAWALTISVVAGTLAGAQLARSRGRWRRLAIGELALPLCLPPVMLGLGLIITLHALGVTRGLWTIITGHALLITPVVTFLVLVRLEGLDPNLEKVAMDLGARPRQAFVYITLPQALPGIAAGALLGAALSIDEFIMTFLVTGKSVTLPLFIYSGIRYQQTPELNALSTMMLASSFLLAAMATVLAGVSGRARSAR